MIADDEELMPKPEYIVTSHMWTKYLVDVQLGIERRTYYLNGELVSEEDLPTGRLLVPPMPIQW